MNDPKEIDKNRFRFLYRLYELSGGHEYNRFNMFEIGQELGFDEELTEDIAGYLQEKGLIKFEDLSGNIEIRKYGVNVLQESLSNPDKPSPHFPPVNEIFSSQSNR